MSHANVFPILMKYIHIFSISPLNIIVKYFLLSKVMKIQREKSWNNGTRICDHCRI